MKPSKLLVAWLACMGALGAQESAEIEGLLEELANPATSWQAEQRLYATGEAAISPLLARLVRDTEAGDLAGAERGLRVLAHLGEPAASELVPFLLQRYSDVLETGPAKARGPSLGASSVVAVFLRSLADLSAHLPRESVHRRTAQFLARDLTQAHRLDDPRSAYERQRLAAMSFFAVELDVSWLLDYLKTDRPPMHAQIAVFCLLAKGTAARPAVSRVHELLEAPPTVEARPIHALAEADLRRACASLLIALIPDDPRCGVAYAHRLTTAGEPEVRRRAAMALARLGEQAAAAIPALIDALDDPDPRVLAEVVTALGVMGPRAGAGAGALERLVSHPDAQVRARAATALRQVRE